MPPDGALIRTCIRWLSSLAKATFQRPSAAALVLRVCPASDTVMVSPFSAQPQTGTPRPHWSTMLSPNTAGKRTAAEATAVSMATAAQHTDPRTML